MYKAMGLSDEELKRPLIGVSTTSNEATPCNIHLGKLGQYAKDGVREAECTPREFTTISVSDVITQGHDFERIRKRTPACRFEAWWPICDARSR